MITYLISLFFGFWLGISALLYITFYWIEVIWDLPLTESESASSAHARLQHLVQRAIEEALRLPPLLDYSGLARDQEGRLPEFTPKTYEDLLATAILNKVINRYQHDLTRNNGASSSGVHSGSSSPGSAEGLNEGPVGAGRVRSRGRLRHRGKIATREDSADPSSLEPMSQEDYGLSDSSGRDSEEPIVIEECTVERSVTSTDDEEEFSTIYNNPIDGALSNISFLPTNRINFPEYGGDIVDMNGSDKNLNSLNLTDNKSSNGNLTLNSEIYANNNSWEENWLFQKKKIKTAQSIPVPMLIPNSNTDYRALIGDRDAEDTTDLSEAGSETEENSTDIKQVLVNSKTIIGGKNSDILLAMIDQDANDNEVIMNGNTADDKLPEPVVQVQKDENDNKTMSSKLIESESNNTVYKADVKIDDAFDELFFKREVPEQLESSKIGKDNIRDYLRNLETEESNEQYGVITQSFDKTPSIMEGEIFACKKITEATNLDVIDHKEEDPHDSLGNHQQESEYTETVAIPVQRHVDSLRRQHDVFIYNDKNNYEKEVIDEIDDAPPPLPSTPLPSTTKLAENIEEILIELTPIPVPKYLNIEENDNIEFTMNGKPFSNDSNTFASFEEHVEDSETEEHDEKEVPGSIAEREHKKWLNAVPMANNPYSPEAIQTRLEKQNKKSVFELMTASQDLISPPSPKIEDTNKSNGVPLQVVLGENITDYKRYGRDYYINESKKSTGARKRLAEMKFGSLPNESNKIKNAPLLRSTSETAAPVSFTGSLNDLEASTLHRTITRVCMRSKNASHDFAINPLFESSFTDESSNQTDMNLLQSQSISNDSKQTSGSCSDFISDDTENNNLSQSDSLRNCSESLKLNIPLKAEVVDLEFETLSSLRKSSTLRNPFRSHKRKHSLNSLFGGSLRLRTNHEPTNWYNV